MTEPVRVSRMPDESLTEYMYRICTSKEEEHWSWKTVAQIINDELGCSYSESYYRKHFKDYSFVAEDEKTLDNPVLSILTELRQERLKLSDERAQNNAILRRLDRENTIIEIAEVACKNLAGKKLLDNTKSISLREGDKKAILQLSDWHYGIEVKNHWNTYNPAVARQRINQLLNITIHKCASFNVDEIWVVNLGDLISGRIHETIRIQNRIDVVTQIMEVTEILMEFIAELVNHGFKVNYVSCNDNHSRLEPKKESSLDLESLTRVTDWVLKLMCNDKINIITNEFGHDIATFKVYDYEVVAVHGHKDSPKNIVPNMSLVTHRHFDLALTAHLHHFSADETNETVILSNGSLMGVDDYAQQLRLTSKPSQNLTICSPDSIVESIHRITL